MAASGISTWQAFVARFIGRRDLHRQQTGQIACRQSRRVWPQTAGRSGMGGPAGPNDHSNGACSSRQAERSVAYPGLGSLQLVGESQLSQREHHPQDTATIRRDHPKKRRCRDGFASHGPNLSGSIFRQGHTGHLELRTDHGLFPERHALAPAKPLRSEWPASFMRQTNGASSWRP